MGTMVDVRQHAVSGLVPPQTAEQLIREIWPSVTGTSPGAARLGEMLMRSIILAPLGWFLLLPFYFLKVLPVVGKRYALTNRRLMVQRGVTRKASHEIALADIDEVRIVPGSQNGFFRSATLEVVSKGQVALKLDGVPEPETFRRAIVNAYKAWVPGRANEPIIPASATK